MDFIVSKLHLVLPAAIVLLAALVGLSDVLRLSWGRIWAISSVCFRESLRRRVLLVIPLAVLGVVAVAAFQRSLDPQDAIRQQLKFCLFAAGLLVVLTVLILASTNLPREIESRVIFTIVTKPTTRLEIVLGKVIGFGRVSALVLGIMGVFTVAYLGFNAWRYQSAIADRLASGQVQPWEKASLEHYREFGLLAAKRLEGPDGVGVYAEPPLDDATGTGTRWFGSFNDGSIQVGFKVDRSLLDAILSTEELDPKQPKLAVEVELAGRPSPNPEHTRRSTATTPLVDASLSRDKISVAISSVFGETIVDQVSLGAGDLPLNPVAGGTTEGGGRARFFIPRKYLQGIYAGSQLYLTVYNTDGTRLLGAGARPVSVFLTDYNGNPLATPDGKQALFEPVPDPLFPSRQFVVFSGRQGRGGQQARGDASGHGTVAFYRFRDAKLPPRTAGPVGLELTVSIERDTSDDSFVDEPTHLRLAFYNRSAPASAAPTIIDGYPENNRTMFLTVPAEAVAGGNFDVAVLCVNTGHWFTAGGGSNVLVVADREPFVFNLAKSLLVLWMMSMLVIVTAVCCSTFLSWPIAIVLTLVILLSRWGVVQLGDNIQSGIGNQVATQLGFRDPASSVAVSRSVEALSAGLRNVAQVLPDISRFSAIEDIERGLQVPRIALTHSGAELATFGLPLLALAYVFLRYKEVAP